MIPVLSREQVRDVDRHAVDVCHVPSIVLMENAGRGAAELVLRRLERRPGPVAIVCGAGNNGGDGFVVARRLAIAGAAVRVLFTSSRERLKGDALSNHDAWLGVGGAIVAVTESHLGRFEEELQGASLVVDGLLGTGLDRPVTGFLAAVIERMNRAPGFRLALDVPSGLDANTGCPLGVAVRADETVTFAALKLGLVTSVGADHAGPVTVVDIGIPPGAGVVGGTSARQLEPADVASWLTPRALSAHKGTAGRVLAIAGSPGKTGAALLVARGALRAGAGLVTLCTFPEAADALDRRVLEEMTARLDPARLEASLEPHLRGADAVVIGPGARAGCPRARRRRPRARRLSGARAGRRGRAHASRGAPHGAPEREGPARAHAAPGRDVTPPRCDHSRGRSRPLSCPGRRGGAVPGGRAPQGRSHPRGRAWRASGRQSFGHTRSRHRGLG